ncbi:MAG: GNAT family N-acetyltransferase [Promethearchaeota archaeon]
MNAEKEEIKTMYEIPIRTALRYGSAYATSENLEGIITFVPGKYGNIKIWNIIRSGALIPALKLNKKYGKLMQGMSKILEEDKRNLNIEPYIYLNVIGVSQKFQGKGLGSKLLKFLIEKADAERKSIYLETESEENVRWYEKFGFKVIKKFTLPDLNLPMWEMVRTSN